MCKDGQKEVKTCSRTLCQKCFQGKFILELMIEISVLVLEIFARSLRQRMSSNSDN